ELVDAEDVALLEARDLLFARLLQYRAFKEAARWFEGHLDAESGRHARSVRLEEKYRRQTPELVWTLSLHDFAALAALAMAPREIPVVGLDHLHAPLVSIREQAAVVVAADVLRPTRGGRRAARRRGGALPGRSRALSARRDRLRAARTARRDHPALDGGALERRPTRDPGGRL